MSAYERRINQDIKKIEALSRSLNKRVEIIKLEGRPPKKIFLRLHYSTAPSQDYPKSVQEITEVKIELLSRYPFQEPTATITTPIFHPNVYSSGKICFGQKWLMTEGLDLLVKRIIQIITFDSIFVDEDSPANQQANKWYRKAIKQKKNYFPTDKLISITENKKPKIKWESVESPNESTKTIISCKLCKKKLRVPSGKNGTIVCPNCNNSFYVKI